MNPAQPAWASFLPFVIIGVVLLIRLRRVGKPRPLRLNLLWILPAIYGLFAAVLLFELPPRGLQWVGCLLALALGCAAGWARGRTMKIAVDPASGGVMVTPSLASLGFLVVLILVRQAFRSEFAGDPHAAKETALFVVELLVSFVVGMLALMRVEMALRARKLLRAA